MPYVKITALVSSKCSPKTVGFTTDPVITEEVLKEAQSLTHKDSLIQLSLDGETIIVTGPVYPPSEELAINTSTFLTTAHDNVAKRHELAAANHKGLVDQYAKAYGLQVLE